MYKDYSKQNKIFIFLILVFFIISFSGCRGDDDDYAPAEKITVSDQVTPPPTPFKFGVMGDTQWTYDLWDPAGENPATVAASFVTQVNQEFIDHGVEFVVQVGDLTNYGYDAAIDARAAAAQSLYDAGIGFFPMRGNHEPWGNLVGMSPDPTNNSYAIPAIQDDFPQTHGVGLNTGGAKNFDSPTTKDPTLPNFDDELDGISYAFDYDNKEGSSATFVIIDPWETDSAQNPLFQKYYGFYVAYPYGYTVGQQQAWISERLDSTTRGTDHAFVFSHQPLIASNHEDSPFGYLAFDEDDMVDNGGGDTVINAPDNTAAQNTFYADLVANDVAMYISGHDHLHDHSMVQSPDGLSSVEQLICAPQCPKLYYPNYSATEWRGQKSRRTVISAQMNAIGYYIFTVEGPIVTVDYYADSTSITTTSSNHTTGYPDGTGSFITPTFNFVLKDTWRFSLNGKGFMVAQGGSYSTVTDTYKGTTVSLTGTNTSTSVEYSAGTDGAQNMHLTKRITTAWKDSQRGLVSSILMLDGMNELGVERTGKYILSMSLASVAGTARLVAQTETGEWVDAASLTAGEPTAISGAASISYNVGTYGIDSASGTVWAVLDYDGTFAIKIN
jgi:hypothetical protein